MKINEFIANVGRKGFDIEVELQVKEYLPIEEKKLIARGIIYECTEEVDGVIKIDSMQRDLSYVKYMILRHTNLEYTNEDYDVLCSSGWLDKIMLLFKTDADECKRILDLMMGDRIREASIEYTVAKFIGGLTNMLEGLSEQLSKKIEQIDLGSVIPKDMDANKLMKFLDTYVK